jgi:hypothetical protein
MSRKKGYLKSKIGIVFHLTTLPLELDETLTCEYLAPEARKYLEQAKELLIKAKEAQYNST